MACKLILFCFQTAQFCSKFMHRYAMHTCVSLGLTHSSFVCPFHLRCKQAVLQVSCSKSGSVSQCLSSLSIRVCMDSTLNTQFKLGLRVQHEHSCMHWMPQHRHTQLCEHSPHGLNSSVVRHFLTIRVWAPALLDHFTCFPLMLLHSYLPLHPVCYSSQDLHMGSSFV